MAEVTFRGLSRTKLARCIQIEPQNESDFYGEVNGELELMMFSKALPEAKIYKDQHEFGEFKFGEIECWVVKTIAEELDKEGDIEDRINNSLKLIVEKWGLLGVYVITQIDDFPIQLSSYEIVYPYLMDLNIGIEEFNRKKYFDEASKRVLALIKDYPEAWEDIGKREWQPFCEDVMLKAKTLIYPLEFLKVIAKEYNVIRLSQAIEVYGEDFRVGLLTSDELSDFLGLPYCVNDKIDLHNRLLEALKDIPSVVSKVVAWNDRQLQTYIEGVKWSSGKIPEVVNKENLIGEPINEYPPGQIFRIFDEGGKIFQFTMEEVMSIATEEINPYTRQKIRIMDFVGLIARPKDHQKGTVRSLLTGLVSPSELY